MMIGHKGFHIKDERKNKVVLAVELSIVPSNSSGTD